MGYWYQRNKVPSIVPSPNSMQRPTRHPQSVGGGDADDQPRSLLRRLREDPTDAVNRIAVEIGARRPTSLGEAQAAAYLDGRMRRAGLRVSADAFRAAYAPDAIAAARTPLDPANVPAHLRGLVPLAEYWGIGDDVLREMMQEGESPAKKKAMADAVTPHNAAITAWLDGLRTGEPMSDEAAAFMYMQLGLTELELFREE